MKMVRLWDGVADGQPYLNSDHPRTTDDALRKRLLKYLRSGRMVLAARTKLPDRLEPERGARVPLVFYTDGEWVWTEEHIYYLDRYGVLPASEFTASIQGRRSAGEVTESQMRQAKGLVVNR